MADLVSEIIDKGAVDQLVYTNTQLELAVKNVSNLATAAKGVVIDFKGAANIGELNAAMAKQGELITKVTDATKQLETASYRKQVAIDKAERDELLGIQRVIAEKEKAAAKEDALILKQLANEDKANAARLKRAQKEEEILNRLIKKEEEAAAKKELIRQKQMKSLEVAEAKEMKMISEAAKQKELANEREEKALAKLNNAYEQLKVQYKKAADEAKRLGAEFGVNDSRATAAAGSAMKLYNSLLAVEKSVGQAQRQVGQYNQAAFAMTQVLREMPAFTYSLATGFMAISNNIPILVDEITKLKASNEALKASGGTTIPIWKTLMSAITSPVGLITIATTAITFLAAKTDIFKSSADEAAKSAENLAKSITEIGKAAESSYENQVQNAQALIDIVSDLGKGEKVRTEAFKELQKLYPQYLKDLTQEQMLKGKAYEAMKNIEEEIRYKVQLEAIESRITALLKERQDIQVELNKPIDDAAKLTALNDRFASINEELKTAKQEFKDYKAAVLSFPTAPEKDKKVKEKKVKDNTFKSESDLLRAEYELNKQRTEQDNAAQKAIADNVDKSLAERLAAYVEYQAGLFELANMERDYLAAIEQAKIQDIKRKKLTATGEELKGLEEQELAANLRIQTIGEAAQGKRTEILKQGEKERLDIFGTSVDAFIKSEQDYINKRLELEIQGYIVEENLLKDALDNKLISRRDYNKKLAELQKKQQIAFINAEIEFDKKILKNQALTPEKREQYEKKLQKDEEALFKAQKGVATPQRKGFRVTDSVAMLFDHDLENEEQYLQEFYDRTVDLANKATDAIIAAKARQFEEENRQLDEQARKIEANYTEQSRLIDATVKDETDRFNQQQRLLAQTEARKSEIEDKRRDIARRQAAFEKAASMAAIIQNTAVAIAGALKYGPGAPPIIALIAAAGAVQLAAASNTPIPAYKEGTTYHTGGRFIAGDGGEKELIIAPNKTPYWSNSISTMYDEAEGTKVIPMSAMQYAMANTTNNTGSLSAAYEARNSAIIAETIGSIVSREFDKTGRKLATVIVNSQPKQQQTESVADELRKMRNLQGI